MNLISIVGIVSLIIAIIGTGFAIIVTAASKTVEIIKESQEGRKEMTNLLATHRVETLEAFHTNADSMRAEVRSYSDEANAHFNALSEGNARLLTLFAEKSIPPYLDSYIEMHVEKAFKKREAQ